MFRLSNLAVHKDIRILLLTVETQSAVLMSFLTSAVVDYFAIFSGLIVLIGLFSLEFSLDHIEFSKANVSDLVLSHACVFGSDSH